MENDLKAHLSDVSNIRADVARKVEQSHFDDYMRVSQCSKCAVCACIASMS